MSTAPLAASLYKALAIVPDPRSRFGRSYSLVSLLTLAAVAMLCGCRSLYAIAQWGRDYNLLAPSWASPGRPRTVPDTAPLAAASCTPSSPPGTRPPSRPF